MRDSKGRGSWFNVLLRNFQFVCISINTIKFFSRVKYQQKKNNCHLNRFKHVLDGSSFLFAILEFWFLIFPNFVFEDPINFMNFLECFVIPIFMDDILKCC